MLTIYRCTAPTAPETQVMYKGIVRSVAFDRDGQESKLAVVP
jgi:hypothetical protein